MTKPKIALVHYSCPPVVGGVEDVVGQQASFFHRYGHEVKIISGKGGIFTKEFPITINPVFSSEKTWQNFAGVEDLRHKTDEIYEVLRKELRSYSILIAHNVMTMPYNLPLTYAIKKVADSGVISVVSWNHDSIYFYPDCPEIYHMQPWDILKTKISSIHYVCISESRCEQFRRLYKTEEDLTVVPDGIDPYVCFQLSPDSRQIISEQKLYEADLVMFQPCRLIPRKNIGLGLRVVSALKKRGIDARYLVTGAYNPHEPSDIQCYRELLKTASDLDILRNVVFFSEYRMKNGRKVTLDQTFVHDLYHIADILFMPSLSEGFGLPLLEAGLMKLPVACSDIPPFIETGRDHICVFSTADTPDRIAGSILRFLAKIPTHNMYRRVIKDYIWDSIYQDYMVPLFKKVITAQSNK